MRRVMSGQGETNVYKNGMDPFACGISAVN